MHNGFQIAVLIKNLLVAVVFAFFAGLPSVINVAPIGQLFLIDALKAQVFGACIIAVCVLPWARRLDRALLKPMSIVVILLVVATAFIQGSASSSLAYNGLPYYLLLVITILAMILAGTIGVILTMKKVTEVLP